MASAAGALILSGSGSFLLWHTYVARPQEGDLLWSLFHLQVHPWVLDYLMRQFPE